MIHMTRHDDQVATGAEPLQAAAPAAATGIDAVLERWTQCQRIVGATVIVLRDGAFIYRRAIGLADREAARPARQDTIYRIASMTKAITSATA